MFDLKSFLVNFRYDPATRIKTAIIILCVITWGFMGFATWWLLSSPGLPASVTANTTAASSTVKPSTPAAKSPMISNVSAVDISDSSAAIVWTTDLPAKSTVEYWVEGSSERTIKENTIPETNHRMVISNLKTQTKYSFSVKSVSAAGLEARSAPGSFDTTAVAVLESPEVGYAAPNFTLTSLNSENVTLSSYKGKWVMLVFWETTCPSCREELPDLQAYSTRMPADKISIVTVNVRNSNEGILSSFIKSRGINLPVLLDNDGSIRDAYKIIQYPTAFFIDSKGIIRLVYDHRFDNTDQIAQTVVSLVGN
jgi:peroxiredoxin